MVLLGAIADDFTGATDLANTLVRGGMRSVQLIDVPPAGTPAPDVDAIVVALKSRTIPAADAIRQSLDALAWLQAAGAGQILFKYCSTFDSTEHGNIGPVAEALMAAIGTDFTVYCPAFPENGRTIFKGYLFVGDVLLSESSMRTHPLTPMTDANLVRVLQRQVAGKVGLVSYRTVADGADAVRAGFKALRSGGVGHAVLDATTDDDLRTLGTALGVPENFRRRGLLPPAGSGADRLEAPPGAAAVIAGSCSAATLGQIAAFRQTHPAFEIDPLSLAQGRDQVAEALAWAEGKLSAEPILIYASAPPDRVQAAQERLGREHAGALVEAALAKVARTLVDRGVRRLVVAGGETSGAVVQALGVTGLRIGPQIDPGVPWTQSLGDPSVALALKSGNFGAADFFLKAFRCLA
jgi:uncharacterized protein YgbK (DUF1537 family)